MTDEEKLFDPDMPAINRWRYAQDALAVAMRQISSPGTIERSTRKALADKLTAALKCLESFNDKIGGQS